MNLLPRKFKPHARMRAVDLDFEAPEGDGKAKRFIKTALNAWAYAPAFETSEIRAAELPKWLHHYNNHRPHSAIGDKPSISRLPKSGNNLLRVHS